MPNLVVIHCAVVLEIVTLLKHSQSCVAATSSTRDGIIYADSIFIVWDLFYSIITKMENVSKNTIKRTSSKKSYLIVYYSCENDFLQETFEECDSFITIDLSSHKHFQVKPCLEPFYPIQEIFKADLR